MNRVIQILAALVMVALGQMAIAAEEVNLYSARKENLIKPLLDKFSEQTGIRVNLVTGKASALLQRLQSEGVNTPADVLLTVDAGRLHKAKSSGLFQAIDSEVLDVQIPPNYRDRDGQWYGLSARSRVLIYSKERVDPAQLSTYEDLADDKWRGKICVRSSSNVYNQSLMASMIANKGESQAEQWAKGVVANFARDPKGNDRAQIKAVAAGECDIAIANTYYMGLMQTSTKDDGQQQAAAKVAVFFPNQRDRGAHMNISGAGVIKHAKNRANAIRLLEFLASDASQQWYAEVNHEYPVKAGVPVSQLVAAWGFPFKTDALNITRLGDHNADAVKAFDRAGWQ